MRQGGWNRGGARVRLYIMSGTMFKRASLLISAGLAFVLSCKKLDPDCATCPCPACPRVVSLTPDHGRPGDTLLLTGQNFSGDPALNFITINDTPVVDILGGNSSELSIIVPQGASSGPVKIKIMDDRALSSDEIPDFQEPIFTLDHFVELVAGSPGLRGSDDGSFGTASFNELQKLSINVTDNELYVLDKTTVSESKTVRRIKDDEVTTVHSSPLSAGVFYRDLTSPINDKVILKFDESGVTGLKRMSLNNFQVTTYQAINYAVSGYLYLDPIGLDNTSGRLYYLIINDQSKFFLMSRDATNGSSPVDTLISFSNSSEVIGGDYEIFGGFIYGATSDAIVKYSLSDLNPSPVTVANGIGLISGLAIDAMGRVYYSKGNQIFRIDGSGNPAPFAGTVTGGFNSDPSLPLSSQFNSIQDIDFDSQNQLFIVDAGNYCVRKLKVD